jgi:tRNA (mo5U34)-methyltransferase
VGSIEWYHTLELAPGVVTPGWFDTRTVVERLPLPASLSGKRCLDIGTFDGFWAFEMERRGADHVVAIDVLDPLAWDWPALSEPETVAAIGHRKARGVGFEIAREALGSRVERRERSIYDLDPGEDGSFEFVYLGSLLLHLRDPVGALERVRSVCAGELLVVDNIDLFLALLLRRRPSATLDGLGRPWWWKPNLAGLVRMIEAAGFEQIDRPRRVYMPRGRGQPRPPLRLRTIRNRAGREAIVAALKGDPHAAVRARSA